MYEGSDFEFVEVPVPFVVSPAIEWVCSWDCELSKLAVKDVLKAALPLTPEPTEPLTVPVPAGPAKAGISILCWCAPAALTWTSPMNPLPPLPTPLKELEPPSSDPAAKATWV